MCRSVLQSWSIENYLRSLILQSLSPSWCEEDMFWTEMVIVRYRLKTYVLLAVSAEGLAEHLSVGTTFIQHICCFIKIMSHWGGSGKQYFFDWGNALKMKRKTGWDIELLIPLHWFESICYLVDSDIWYKTWTSCYISSTGIDLPSQQFI